MAVTEKQIGAYHLTFSDANHQYRVKIGEKGKSMPVPSVTSITGMLDKPGLVYWSANLTANFIFDRLIKKGKLVQHLRPDEIFELAKKQHSAELQKAGDFGSSVHDRIHHWFKGKAMTKEERASKAEDLKLVCRFVDWFKEWSGGQWTTCGTEMRVFYKDQKRGMYAGTMDLKIKTKEHGTAILDFKTSKSIHIPEMPMQLSAYARADEWETGEDVNNIGIVHLTRDEGVRYYDFTPIREKSELAFFHLLQAKAAIREISNGKGE